MRGAVNSSYGKGRSYKTQDEAHASRPAGHVGILFPHERVGGVSLGERGDANHDDEPHADVDKHYDS